VISGRHRHHRTRDHFGADSDLYVTLEEPIAHWGAGTPLHYVLAELWDRQAAFASGDHQVRVLYLNSWVMTTSVNEGGRGIKALDAIVKRTPTGSFTIQALIVTGGSATLDAWVSGAASLSLNAWVV